MSQNNQESDLEAIDRILEGKTWYFEEIIRRYNQRLYRVIKGYVLDDYLVQDILQVTYLKAFEKLSTYKRLASFSTWLTRIAINEALMHVKSDKSHRSLHKYDDSYSDFYQKDSALNPLELLIEQDVKKLLEHTIQRLPPHYRSVYIMREVEKISTKEVSDLLQTTESNVKIRLMRAKAKMKEMLEHVVGATRLFSFLGDRCDYITKSVMSKITNTQSPVSYR